MPFDADLLLRALFRQSPVRHPAAKPTPRSASRPAGPVSRLPDEIDTPSRSEWMAAWKRAPQVVPPPRPCSWCRSSVFWRSIHGVYVCSNCHPPSYPALAEMWLQLVATDDGPRLVRLKVEPSTE
jgi:hypothetical protein